MFGLVAVLLAAGCDESTPVGVPVAAVSQLRASGQGEPAALPAIDPASATWTELIARVPPGATEVSRVPSTGERVPHPVAAEIAARLVRGERPSDGEWAELLLRSGAVRYRETWPIDQPWVLSMRVPNWLGQATVELESRSIHFRSAKAGTLEPPFCGTCWMGMVSQADHQELGNVRLGEQTVRFDARICWGPAPYANAFPNLPDPGEQVLWEGRITLPVRGVASLSDALPPAVGPDIDAAMRRAVTFLPSDGTLRRVYSRQSEPLLRDVGVAIDVELRSDGVVLERLEFLPSRDWGELFGHSQGASAMSAVSRRVSPETIALLRERGTWTIAVRGKQDPSLLTDWGANRHFAGSYEFQAP